MYNPILDFKYFIKFFDVVCIILVINSLLITPLEDLKDRKFGVLRIINTFVQFSILIIYIIRFIKFTKVKQFFFDNRDIYENDSYFPNKVLNFDSVPLAVSLNLFIINLLYVIFLNHNFFDTCEGFEGCCCFEKNEHQDSKKNCLLFLFFVTKFVFYLLDIINDPKIFPVCDNIISNWEIYPIVDIEFKKTNQDSKSNLEWRGKTLELERVEKYNYMDIFSDDYEKLCGKDNLGNNLYFPWNQKCPINDIFISKYRNDLPDYKWLRLDYNHYLYYTNAKTDGKILVDLRISSDSEIALNPGGDS